MDLDEEEADYVKTIGLLSYKPIIYVANVSDDGVADAEADKTLMLRPFAKSQRKKARRSLSSVRKSKPKWQNLMMKSAACSSKNWESKSRVLTSS